MAITDLTRSGLTLQDIFGNEQPPKWGPQLLVALNTQRRIFVQAIQQIGIESMKWEYRTALFSHGVAVSIRASKTSTPRGVIVLSADGQGIAGWRVDASALPGQMKLAIQFDDVTAKNVSVGFYIVPDGVASSG